MASDASGSRDPVHDERRKIVALLNRFNAVNDGNALDQNYADHLHQYFGSVFLTLTLMILILAIVKMIALKSKHQDSAYSVDIGDF